MLVAKISFYFENAKKNGRKVSGKVWISIFYKVKVKDSHPIPQLIKNTSIGNKHSFDAFISVFIIKFCLSTSRLTQRYFKPWKQVARNHHTAISSTQQVSRHDEGSIRHLFIVAYRPLSCHIKNAISNFFRNFSLKSLAGLKIKS